MSLNLPGVAPAGLAGFAACAAARTLLASQAAMQTLVRRIDKHFTIALVADIRSFGAFLIARPEQDLRMGCILKVLTSKTP